MKDVLLHHVLVVLLEDVLDLLEVLLAPVGKVFLGDFAASLDELLLEMDALLQGLVLLLIMGAV